MKHYCIELIYYKDYGGIVRFKTTQSDTMRAAIQKAISLFFDELREEDGKVINGRMICDRCFEELWRVHL